MAVSIANREIRTIYVVDDDNEARNGYGLTVEEMPVETKLQEHKVDNLNTFLLSFSNYDAVVSDHHLRKSSNYFPTNGAEFVAKCYQKNIPSILVTKYEAESFHEIRPYKQYIPIVLRPDEFNPESLEISLEICIKEFRGEIAPVRKPWRTLVRVDDKVDNSVLVILPSWDLNRGISLQLDEFPHDLQTMIEPDFRFTADVNIDAENATELYFTNWKPLKRKS